MNNSLISIIVPIYNSEKNLKKCIDSILNQSHNNIELILIDDGSIDSSYNICKEYQKKDKRVIVHHQNNSGVSAARNYGLQVAKGKYIGFVDADDYIESNMFECLLNEIIKTNSKMAICNYYFEDENAKIITSYNNNNFVFSSNKLPIYMFNILCINGFLCNKLYDRELIIKNKKMLLLDTNIRMMEDNLFNYNLYDNNDVFNCTYINDKLYHYVQMSNSACNNKFNYNKLQYFIVRDKQIDILESKGMNADYLKADYVISFTKAKIKLNILRLTPTNAYKEIENNKNKYKKQIDIRKLNKRTKIKYIISICFPIIYLISILIKKENI